MLELVCHRSRFVHHILCESPFLSRDVYAIRPLILWHILGAYFLLIWGVGVVKIVLIVCAGTLLFFCPLRGSLSESSRQKSQQVSVSQSPKASHHKAVCWIFEISDSNPMRGKRRKCGRFKETPRSKKRRNVENAQNADAKCGKCS